jgi:hypothetical protein
MRPVFKLKTLRATKPKVGFMNQRGRLQRVPGRGSAFSETTVCK